MADGAPPVGTLRLHGSRSSATFPASAPRTAAEHRHRDVGDGVSGSRLVSRWLRRVRWLRRLRRISRVRRLRWRKRVPLHTPASVRHERRWPLGTVRRRLRRSPTRPAGRRWPPRSRSVSRSGTRFGARRRSQRRWPRSQSRRESRPAQRPARGVRRARHRAESKAPGPAPIALSAPPGTGRRARAGPLVPVAPSRRTARADADAARAARSRRTAPRLRSRTRLRSRPANPRRRSLRTRRIVVGPGSRGDLATPTGDRGTRKANGADRVIAVGVGNLVVDDTAP